MQIVPVPGQFPGHGVERLFEAPEFALPQFRNPVFQDSLVNIYAAPDNFLCAPFNIDQRFQTVSLINISSKSHFCGNAQPNTGDGLSQPFLTQVGVEG